MAGVTTICALDAELALSTSLQQSGLAPDSAMFFVFENNANKIPSARWLALSALWFCALGSIRQCER
jgi:hypothetical protein